MPDTLSAVAVDAYRARVLIVENDEGAARFLAKALDEEVARLHLDKIGAKLSTLTPKQADYLGVPVEGPYKSESYRY